MSHFSIREGSEPSSSGRQDVSARGVVFRVSKPQGFVREVLEITNVAELFHVRPATAPAVTSVAAADSGMA